MKVALIDDELEIIEHLTEYFGKIAGKLETEFEIKGFHSPGAFLEKAEDFDLICLDISMPEMNGLDLAHKIRERDENVAIMFVTNMSQYALRGYEVHAVDFLVKPITYGEFEIKVKKALRFLKRDSDKSISVKTNTGTVYVKQSDIWYVEVMKHKISLHTQQGNYETRSSMAQIEELLPNSFVRSANSFLVNLKYVSEVTYNTVKAGTDTIPLTRTRRKQFMDSLTRYMGGIE